jgi:ferredoxin
MNLFLNRRRVSHGGKNIIATAGLPPIFARSNPNLMADAANKYPENVPGKFYVDDQCIDCDLCRETAPANFKRNDDGGHSYVFKQPENEEEERLSREAMEGCPVEAIGDDGA